MVALYNCLYNIILCVKFTHLCDAVFCKLDYFCNIACISLGLGLALNFQPSLIMLNRYFNEKRPLANGLAAAGSPVALCCLSPLGQILQYQYGWRGGFLLLGGMLLNCCVCGALMRPLLLPKKPQELDESSPTAAEKEKKPQPKKKLLDFSVFKDRGFVIYTIAASVMVLGLFVPPVFVVNYAKSLDYEDTKSALLLTILGFVDMFARPASGLITGMKCVRPRSVYLFSFAIIFNGLTDIIGSQVTMHQCVLYYKENGEEHDYATKTNQDLQLLHKLTRNHVFCHHTGPITGPTWLFLGENRKTKQKVRLIKSK